MNNKIQKLKHKKSPATKKQQIQQERYNIRFNINQRAKQYNALQDPHATFYFINASVRNHLKNIKRATLNETTNQVQKARLKKLLNQKINFKLKSLSLNKNDLKSDGYLFNKKDKNQLQQLIPSSTARKISIQTVQSHRVNRKFSKQRRSYKFSQQRPSHKFSQSKYNTVNPTASLKNQDQLTFSQYLKKNQVVQNQEDLIIKTKDEQFFDKKGKKPKYQTLNERKHRKFMNFIEEKKKLVTKVSQKQKVQNINILSML